MQYGIGGVGLIIIVVAIAIIVGGPTLATISANQAWAKAMVQAERTTRMMVWSLTFLAVTAMFCVFGLIAYLAHLRASFGIAPNDPIRQISNVVRTAKIYVGPGQDRYTAYITAYDRGLVSESDVINYIETEKEEERGMVVYK